MFALKWWKITTFLAVLALVLSLAGCREGPADGERVDKNTFLMDTKVDFSVYGLDEEEASRASEEVFAEMRRLENIFSRHAEDSDVTRLNEAAGEEWIQVEPETVFVLEKALEAAELSEGAFDPTVGPLLALWGFGRDELQVPRHREIEEILPLVDYREIKVDREQSRVYLPHPGMKLDLGGIAKGYIVDRGQEVAMEHDVEASFVNAGGDINIKGSRPWGEEWRIGIRDPDEAAELFAVVTLKEGSIATSGDYQRYFEENGRRYHHILDPHSGYPAEGMKSVTIIAESAMEADAISTAVFVLGPGKGLELLEELPGVEGIMIDGSREVFLTSGMKDLIEIKAE